MELRFFDSHAHLNNPKFSEDAAAVRQKAKEGGVTALLNAGYDLSSSALSIEQASELEGVWASVGMHPHDAKDYDEKAEELFREWAKNPKLLRLVRLVWIIITSIRQGRLSERSLSVK